MIRVIPYIQLAWVIVLALPLIFTNLLTENSSIFFLVPVLFILWTIGLCIKNYSVLPNSNVLGLLLFWLIPAFGISIDKTLSYSSIAILCIGIALYLLIVTASWLRNQPQRLGWALVLLSTLLTIISPPIIAWKQMRFRFLELPIYDFFQSLSFSQTETIHANVIAGALVLLLPLVVALLLHSGQLFSSHGFFLSFMPKIGLLFLSLSMLILVVLTQSRGAYLGIFVAFAIIFLLRWPRLLYLVPVALIAIVGGVYSFGPQATFELLGADNTFGGTADFRLVTWAAARKAIRDFSLTGIGIGTFTAVMPLLYSTQFINSESATHAHNLFLQTGLDLGVPGLTFYWLFVASIFGMAIYALKYRLNGQSRNFINTSEAGPGHTAAHRNKSKRRHRRDTGLSKRPNSEGSFAEIAMYRALIHGSIAAILGMLVHGLLDAVTWGTKLAFIPWLIYALVSIIYLDLVRPITVPNHSASKTEADFEIQWSIPTP